MSILPSSSAPATPRYTRLAECEDRVCTLAEALWQVRRADRVALAARMNRQGNYTVVDVSRACAVRALKALRGRARKVEIGDILGTVVIGVAE